MSGRSGSFSSMPKSSVTARLKSVATKKRYNSVARGARRYKGYKKGKKTVRKGKTARAKVRREIELLENRKKGLKRELQLEDNPRKVERIKNDIADVDRELKKAKIRLSKAQEKVDKGKIERDTRALGNKGRTPGRRAANRAAKSGMKALGGLGGAGAALAGMGLLGAGAATVQS